MVAGGFRVLTGNRVQTLAPGSVISALDIGSTKTTCLIAVVEDDRSAVPSLRALRVLGHGTTVSRGIVNGTIANLVDTERTIRLAVDAAERGARVRVHDVHVNVSSGRPQSETSTAHVRVQSGTVSARDIDQVIAAAVTKLDISRRTVLHIAPVTFSLDGVDMEDAPSGMHGEVLGAEVCVVAVEQAGLRNLKQAVARAHLQAQSYSHSVLAAGRGVLLPDELALGVAVIDMGGATTDFAIFRNGRFTFSGSVPLGGAHVTNDIAHGLSTTLAHAERLKTMFGSAISFGPDERETLAVPLLGERGVDSIHHVPKTALTAIIRPRIEEIFEMVRAKLLSGSAFAGVTRVVLTGGAGQLQGLREFASAFLGCTVRIGQPSGLQGLSEHTLTGALAVPAGLLAMAYAPERMLAMPEAAQDALARANMGYVRRVSQWLKEAF